MIRQNRNIILFSLILIIGLASCNHDKTKPGYAYMPDMYYSEAYNAYSDNPVFSDSMTNQTPPSGSIARGFMPYPYHPKNADDQRLAGEELVNTVEADKGSIAKGKAKYMVYCINCHGELGDGSGYLYTSKLFSAKPTSLIEPYVQNKNDGEIFHVITMGSVSGLMGAHGSQIKAEDRWNIINYIRNDLAK